MPSESPEYVGFMHFTCVFYCFISLSLTKRFHAAHSVRVFFFEKLTAEGWAVL